MAEQLSMFEPAKRKSGLLYLPNYLTIADQKDLLNDLRTVVRQSPLFTPTMSSGAPFRYKMTNIGDLGWNSDRKGYRYESRHPVTGQPYPEIPSSLRSMIDDLSGKFGEKIRPDAVLLNWYPDGAKLGLHQDSTEKVSKPVVSLSLGDRGVFSIDTTGSRDRSTAMKNLERINVNSGDAIVFGGDLRNAYHAVERIDAGTAPPELGMKNSGRINLTARQVNGFSTLPALTGLSLGTTGIIGGAIAGRAIAKTLGANEDQQNIAAGIGGSLGGLTGVTTGYSGKTATAPVSFQDAASRALGVNTARSRIESEKPSTNVYDSLRDRVSQFAASPADTFSFRDSGSGLGSIDIRKDTVNGNKVLLLWNIVGANSEGYDTGFTPKVRSNEGFARKTFRALTSASALPIIPAGVINPRIQRIFEKSGYTSLIDDVFEDAKSPKKYIPKGLEYQRQDISREGKQGFEYGQKFASPKSGEIASLVTADIKGGAVLETLDGDRVQLASDQYQKLNVKTPATLTDLKRGDGLIANKSDQRYTVMETTPDAVKLRGEDGAIKTARKSQVPEFFRPNPLGISSSFGSNPFAKLAKGFAMREGARILAKELGADEQQQQAVADAVTVVNVATAIADNSRVNNMAANKKINTGSLSTSVKEPKSQKLTTDTLYKYLQMMGGEPVIVKPDGKQATKGKFAFGQDVGLNNEFTKLPEIHVRFDDPKISSLVAKELATGELTVGMQRNPQTGEIETITKKFEPIPSRGNTQMRGYRLGNDPTGDYLAFNKPEEAYKAPKSLKELQADLRKSYQAFDLKPNASLPELEAAVQPRLNEVKNNPDLRDRLQTVLSDMQSRQVLKPVATPEPEPVRSQPNKTRLALESDRIGGYQPKHVPKILEALQDEDTYRAILGSMSAADQERFNSGLLALEEGEKFGNRDVLATLNRARRDVPRLGGDMYANDARKAFSQLDDALGVQFGFNKTLQFGLKEFANSAQTSYRVDIPDQAKIELVRAKIDGVDAFKVANIVAYNPENVGDRFAMKTLKFLQENLPKPVVMGNVINEKFARIFEKQGYTRQDNNFLPPDFPRKAKTDLTGFVPQAIAPESQLKLNAEQTLDTPSDAWKFPQRNERSLPNFYPQMASGENPLGTGATVQSTYERAKSAYQGYQDFGYAPSDRKFPTFREMVKLAESEGVKGDEAIKAYIKGKQNAPLIDAGVIDAPELPLTARLGQEYISPKTGKLGTVESVGKKGVKLNVDGQVVPIEYTTLEKLKYTGNKGYGFTANTAMDLPARFAKGFAIREGSRLLAKQLGANEEQQNAIADAATVAQVSSAIFQNVTRNNQLTPSQQAQALEFNQRYESGAIAKRESSLSEPEDLGLGRAMTPEEFARKFPDKAKGFGLEVKPQVEAVFPKYEPKPISKEPKKVVLQDFQVGQEVVSTGSKGFQGRIADVSDGQVTLENYQGKRKTVPLELASASLAPAEYRQPLQLGEYDYKAQRTPKEAIPDLPKNAFSTPAKDLKFTPASKVPFNERYLQNKGFKITYNDPASGVMEVKPPDLVPVNGKSLKLNDYLSASKEWRTNALNTTGALRDLDYQIPLTDKQGRTALEQAIFEANNSLPPAPSRSDFMVEPPKQKLKEFLSRGSKPFVPESMSNVDNLKQAMSQAEALGDIESQMNIAKQLEKVQSKRVVKKVSGGGFNKAKQAIAQTVKDAVETALDVVYQPSKSQPKPSNFIAESTVEAAAKSSGATTAQVKAQIANQRASGLAPDLNKATEAISVQRSNLAFEQNISQPRSLKELQQPTRSPQQFTFNPPMPEPVMPTRAKTPSWELPAADFVPLKNPNTIIDRKINQLDSALKAPVGGKIGDRIGASGLGLLMDTAQAANVLNESASRGENASTALSRAGLSVGAGYAATGLASFIPNPYLRTAAQLGGGIAAVVGADKAIDQVVGRDEAKEQKFAKDLSKLDLQTTNEKEQWKPFANDSNIAAAYANSFTAQIQSNLDYRPAARSLANLTNKDAIDNARYASERDASIKAGMDAKSNKSIAYEQRGNVTVAYGRDRGYTSTESRVLALQNLANESGYEVPRTGKFESKTLDALEKLGYSQSQISDYIQGKTKAIGKPRQTGNAGLAVKQAMANRSGEKVTSQQLSQALAAERKAQGLKGGEMLNQSQVDQVFSSLAGRSLTQLRQSAKVGGKTTQSALRLGAGIR